MAREERRALRELEKDLRGDGEAPGAAALGIGLIGIHLGHWREALA